MNDESSQADSETPSSNQNKTWIDRLFPASPRMLHIAPLLIFLSLAILIVHIPILVLARNGGRPPTSYYWLLKSDEEWTVWDYQQWESNKSNPEYIILIRVFVNELHHSSYLRFLYSMWTAQRARISLDSEVPSIRFDNEKSVEDMLPIVINSYISDPDTFYQLPLDKLEYDISLSDNHFYASALSETTNFRILWSGVFGNALLITCHVTFLWACICHIRSEKYIVPFKEKQRRKRLSRSRCPKCRYNIHHLPTRRCPECGETWTQEEDQPIVKIPDD